MYACSRHLLPHGYRATAAGIDTAVVNTAYQRRYRWNAGMGLIIELSLLR
jgi:hypothetical protein